MRNKGEVGLSDSRRVDWVLRTLLGACLMVIAADFLYEKRGYVPWEGWIGFQGGFGFLSGVILVLAARWLQRLLRRGGDHYER
jgi:hypothetical protein